ncbi:MAG: hypothetical protein A2Y12_08715 [Planctomycetes bacterium GWF2_42_9]|nr:MAG: hypothetical protein A2Y12_08715 [Planctomycetes bacterium GWF2_42_9]HAL45479.1 hypothetical protein [Phycisphaerales bacterium]
MTDALKIKAKRQILLMLLNIVYPSPITIRQFYNSAIDGDPTYDETIFEKDVTYFFDKGWIEFIDNKIGGFKSFKDKVIKLSAKGKEIAEGTDVDKALEI